MVLLKASVEVVIGECLCSVLMREDGTRLGVLFEVLNIVGGVSSPECGDVASTAMLPLP